MLPRKTVAILVVAILALFGQFLGKFCLYFLPLNLSVSPNMMHFVHIFSIMHAQDLRLPKKFEITEKPYSSKTMFENGW